MNKALRRNKVSWKKTRYYRIYLKKVFIGRGYALSIYALGSAQVKAIQSAVCHTPGDRSKKSIAIATAVIETHQSAIKALSLWL